jgi:hypothetical protein
MRVKAASLVGLLAKHDSIASPEIFEQAFMSTLLRQVCQDLHWEVRKEMCGQLLLFSKYLGAQKSRDIILPELKELLDDEESEVMSEAINQF